MPIWWGHPLDSSARIIRPFLCPMHRTLRWNPGTMRPARVEFTAINPTSTRVSSSVSTPNAVSMYSAVADLPVHLQRLSMKVETFQGSATRAPTSVEVFVAREPTVDRTVAGDPPGIAEHLSGVAEQVLVRSQLAHQ